MKLILIRHGQTTWNKAKRYQGKTDIPLSSVGKRQAVRVAERLRHEPIKRIFSSTLQRALSTAAPIARSHGLRIESRECLCERSYGAWEGLSKEDVGEKFPEDIARYEKNRYSQRPTGGESLLDLERKLTPLIKKIRAMCRSRGTAKDAVAIVAHNGSLRALFRSLTDAPGKKVGKLAFKEASVTSLTLKGGKVKVDYFNSITHLRKRKSHLHQQPDR